MGQFGHHLSRDLVPLAWIDESQDHEMCEQDSPMLSKSLQQAIPVQAVGIFVNEVHDVRAVEALALHDECFGPDHLLERT